MASCWFSGSWNTFMQLLNQKPSVAVERCFCFSELQCFAFPPSDSQPDESWWSGWSQPLLLDWVLAGRGLAMETCRNPWQKWKNHLHARLPVRTNRHGCIHFIEDVGLYLFGLYSKVSKINEFWWQLRHSIISLSANSAFLHLLVIYI